MGKDESEGKTWTYAAQDAGGGEALQKAVDAGEVKKFMKDGIAF